MGRKKGNKLPIYDERDGPRYMTVQHPYPMNADMDIEDDRMAFAYWIASCIGRENLLAFFHKPNVRDLRRCPAVDAVEDAAATTSSSTN
ncbi:hypothetical protein DAEQUDRAFT_723090 [Daedalea quercina L-15889]|uniref:Uncharacterized protein n=1 Tax=Daedalea quercina L-15889 TaxID=1314783 RepID=A0A165SRH9_9APHY|nr:hypothetical protein DAEQUDRAFT_723090 [Daedalea quercina L-15889]